MHEAYIVGGFRTAVTKSKKGGFRFTRPDDLAVKLIQELMRSVPSLADQPVDDVIVGNAVPEAEQGLQVGRIIAARALGNQTPGMTINRYCASGLEAIAIATAKIRAGMADIIVAGGVESMSLVPTSGWKTVPSYEIASTEPDYYLNMGLTAEAVAKDFHISRADQDAFSLRSHQKALVAIEQGHFRSGILPIPVEEIYLDEKGKKQKRQFVVDTDEGPRSDTSLEALAKLKPAFSPVGTVTAGNASQTSDGAAFVIVMSERKMKELGLSPIGRLISCSVAGVPPRIMGMGPVAAIPLALKQAGLTLGQIDLIELNEAFAAQALAVIREAGLDEDKVNINGGAMALGHPIGATGAMLIGTALDERERSAGRYALVTMCAAGGMAPAIILERIGA